MKGKKRIIIIAVAVILVLAAVGAALFFFLPRNEEEEIEQPEEIKIEFPLVYKLNDIEIPALRHISQDAEEANPEEAAQQPAAPQKEEPAKDPEENPEGAEEGSEEEKPEWKQESISATYTYRNFPDLLESITQYVSELTGGKGYFAVDEELEKKKAVPAQGEEGTYCLAKKGAEEGTVLHIKITWSGTDCSVVASYMPGEIKEPKKPGQSEYYEMQKAISILQAKEFVWSLPPSVLGLEGQSMSEYRIYTADIDVLVDGYPCIRLSIFEKAEGAGTNEPVGEYCLSRSGDKLYKIDKSTHKVQKIDLPDGAVA